MSHSDHAVFAAHVKASAISREAEREARRARAAGRPVFVPSQAEVEAAVAANLAAAGFSAPQPHKNPPSATESTVQAILDARTLALGLRN